MKTYHSITLTVNKNKKEGDNLPNFNMSVADKKEDGKVEFKNIGGGWKKLDKNGQSYMSLGLANAFNKETNEPLTYTNQNGDIKFKDGYVVVNERDLRELMKQVTDATGQAFVENINF